MWLVQLPHQKVQKKKKRHAGITEGTKLKCTSRGGL